MINIGFIYDLSTFENLSKIWKLVGWVVPIDYTNIIENTPRRKCYSVDKYEDLINYELLLNKIRDMGIKCKHNYPTNITKYCRGGMTINNYTPISKDLILNNPNFDEYKHYDVLLNYV